MVNDILWEISPHTEMKHEILRRYLAAWFPIISKISSRLVIIDGFAGPGEYTNGEPGSPVIILNTIIGHKLKARVGEAVLLFIEKNTERADFLEKLLVRRYSPAKINDTAYQLENGRIKFQIVKGDFESTLSEILDNLQERGSQMAPCFAFIDPFGPSGIPMKIIARLFEQPKPEILINFAFDKINRFLTASTHEKIFDELYGCPDWRNLRSEKDINTRHKGVIDLYISQLKSATKAVYVLPFKMRDKKNRLIYHLIFATKHWRGLDVMKQAMWGADPTGNFQFSDYTYKPNQLSLFPTEPDFEELSELIHRRFFGQTVTPGNIEEWVVTETSRYASIHMRRALNLLEDRGKLKKYNAQLVPGKGLIIGSPYLRKRAFPNDKIVIEFL